MNIMNEHSEILKGLLEKWGRYVDENIIPKDFAKAFKIDPYKENHRPVTR